MSQAALRRAAGAYADEVLNHLGGLLLRCAVMAGMRRKDGNTYLPDPGLLGTSYDAVRAAIRKVWLEHAALGHSVLQCSVDTFLAPSPRGPKEQFPLDWSDDLGLARLALVCSPRQPYAMIAHGAACFRRGHFEDARRSLVEADSVARCHSLTVRARVLRNLAAVEEWTGISPSCVVLARRAAEMVPFETEAVCSYLAYSITHRQSEDALRALTMLWKCATRDALYRSSLQHVESRIAAKSRRGLSPNSHHGGLTSLPEQSIHKYVLELASA